MVAKGIVGAATVGVTYFGIKAGIGPRHKRFQSKVKGVSHKYIKENLKAYPLISTHLAVLVDFATTDVAKIAFNNIVVHCCKVGHMDNKFWAKKYTLEEQAQRLRAIHTATNKVQRDCNILKAQVAGVPCTEYDGNDSDDMDDIDMSIKCIVGQLRDIAYVMSNAHDFNKRHRRGTTVE
jgi:hypothetical protein